MSYTQRGVIRSYRLGLLSLVYRKWRGDIEVYKIKRGIVARMDVHVFFQGQGILKLEATI